MPVFAGCDNRVTLLVDLNMTCDVGCIWGGEEWQATYPIWVPLSLGDAVWLLDEDHRRIPAVIYDLSYPPFGDGRARHYKARMDWVHRSASAVVRYS